METFVWREGEAKLKSIDVSNLASRPIALYLQEATTTQLGPSAQWNQGRRSLHYTEAPSTDIASVFM